MFQKIKYQLYQLKVKLLSFLRGEVKHSKPHGWFGNYKTWQEVERLCNGYDAADILKKVRQSVLKVRNGEAVYERDSVLFNEIQYSPALIEAFKKSIKDNTLHVVDFGGSLGSSYFQHQ